MDKQQKLVQQEEDYRSYLQSVQAPSALSSLINNQKTIENRSEASPVMTQSVPNSETVGVSNPLDLSKLPPLPARFPTFPTSMIANTLNTTKVFTSNSSSASAQAAFPPQAKPGPTNVTTATNNATSAIPSNPSLAALRNYELATQLVSQQGAVTKFLGMYGTPIAMISVH